MNKALILCDLINHLTGVVLDSKLLHDNVGYWQLPHNLQAKARLPIQPPDGLDLFWGRSPLLHGNREGNCWILAVFVWCFALHILAPVLQDQNIALSEALLTKRLSCNDE